MKTWGDIFYAALRRGDDHGHAAYLADRYMKRHSMVRHAYDRPIAVGWAAWWTQNGMLVAFEHLDGTMIYTWG